MSALSPGLPPLYCASCGFQATNCQCSVNDAGSALQKRIADAWTEAIKAVAVKRKEQMGKV